MPQPPPMRVAAPSFSGGVGLVTQEVHTVWWWWCVAEVAKGSGREPACERDRPPRRRQKESVGGRKVSVKCGGGRGASVVLPCSFPCSFTPRFAAHQKKESPCAPPRSIRCTSTPSCSRCRQANPELEPVIVPAAPVPGTPRAPAAEAFLLRPPTAARGRPLPLPPPPPSSPLRPPAPPSPRPPPSRPAPAGRPSWRGPPYSALRPPRWACPWRCGRRTSAGIAA